MTHPRYSTAMGNAEDNDGVDTEVSPIVVVVVPVVTVVNVNVEVEKAEVTFQFGGGK